MKAAYKIFLAVVLAFTIWMVFKMDRQLINPELQGNAVVIESHRIVYSRWYSLVQCEGKTLQSFAYPTTGLPCTSVAYCQANWPFGVSYEVRDSEAVCCTDSDSEAIGECGRWI